MIDKQKENFAADWPFSPKNKPVEIVAPLLDMPGKAAIPCARPINPALKNDMPSVPSLIKLAAISQTPVIISIKPTVLTLLNAASICFTKNKTKIKVTALPARIKKPILFLVVTLFS